MFRNVASQKIAVFAFDTVAKIGKTGDAANITAQISKDFGASAASNDTNPTELDATNHPGLYVFDLTQAETDADVFTLTAKTSTGAAGDIQIEPISIATMLDKTPIPELAQGVPPITPTPREAAVFNYMEQRNRGDQTATEKKVYNDAGIVVAKHATSDTGGVTSRGKAVSGP